MNRWNQLEITWLLSVFITGKFDYTELRGREYLNFSESEGLVRETEDRFSPLYHDFPIPHKLIRGSEASEAPSLALEADAYWPGVEKSL